MNLKLGSTGEMVVILQQLLNVPQTGVFDTATDLAVKQWQKANGLVADGIVGPLTRNAMGLIDTDISNSETLIYKKHWLNPDEYDKGPYKKEWIFLHHTAGWENPYHTINVWESDTRGPVATEFVLGGPSILGNNTQFDGELVSAFPAGGYGWHLTIGNTTMHKNSVGIELCNFGFLTRGGYWKFNKVLNRNEWIKLNNDKFYTYVGTEAHPSQIVKLNKKYRGFEYWHRYSDKQISVLRDWILWVANRDSIDPRKGLIELIKNVGGFAAFDKCDVNMCANTKGLWLHSNVIAGKNDLFPQPELIDMLLSI